MKKILLFLTATLLTFAFAGCSDDDSSDATLEIVKSEVGFDAAGGQGTIEIRTSEKEINAKPDKEWLHISEKTTTMIAFSLDENLDPLQRAASITITAGNVKKTVSILQAGEKFGIDAEKIEIDPTGAKPSYVDYDTSVDSDPVVTIPASAPWLHASNEEKQIKLVADPNLAAARSTKVTVTLGWKTVQITVSQAIIELVDPTEVSLATDGGSEVVTVSDYINQITSSWNVQTNDTWFTLTKGVSDFTVTAPANTTSNALSGTIELVASDGNVLATIAVSQNGDTSNYSYDTFLGNWTLNYNSDKTLAITLTANDDRTGYIMSGLQLDVEMGYEDSGTEPKLTLKTQYLGYDSGNGYYVYVGMVDNAAGYISIGDGFGLDFVLDGSTSILRAKDNGVWGTYKADSFFLAGYDAQTGGSYKAWYEQIISITTLSR